MDRNCICVSVLFDVYLDKRRKCKEEFEADGDGKRSYYRRRVNTVRCRPRWPPGWLWAATLGEDAPVGAAGSELLGKGGGEGWLRVGRRLESGLITC